MIEYNKNLAEKYNGYHQYPLGNLQVNRLRQLFGIDSTTKILDIGCGTGRLLKELRPYYRHLYGVEYSKNMYDQCVINLNGDTNLLNLNFNDVEAVADKFGKFDIVYFSYSLHQINPNKKKQIELLQRCFDSLQCNSIVLITASEAQFRESFLNMNSRKIKCIDDDRFLFKHEIQQEFDVKYYEEETIYLEYFRDEFIQMLGNRYISTLQYLDDTELEVLIDKLPNTLTVTIPDYYTYIHIHQKNK